MVLKLITSCVDRKASKKSRAYFRGHLLLARRTPCCWNLNSPNFQCLVDRLMKADLRRCFESSHEMVSVSFGQLVDFWMEKGLPIYFKGGCRNLGKLHAA
jgi:hypothetical protein